jgi:serine/threonine protein kinase
MIDFKSYGILIDSLKNIDSLTHTDLVKGHVEKVDNDVKYIVMDTVKYKIVGEPLGKGTFGTTYKVSHDNKEYAIKYVKSQLDTPARINGFIKEAIIQIILAEEGPHVPALYTIAYNPKTKEGFIRSELMRNTARNLIAVLSTQEMATVIPDIIIQVAKILQFYGDKLKFNHRDLKTDNIMYNRDPVTNMRTYKLIDFGFSCLTYKGVEIKGSTYFAAEATCFRENRDISQFMYEIAKYVKIPAELFKILNKLLTANVHHTTCKLLKDCVGLKAWKNTYGFLDRTNVVMKKPTTDTIITEMTNYLKQLKEPAPKPKEQKPAPKPKEPQPIVAMEEPKGICPAEKIYNPKTRRCVNRNGPIGLKLLNKVASPKDCPEGKIRNPKTRRCIKAQKKLVECPEGKIRNPKTRRCIKAKKNT